MKRALLLLVVLATAGLVTAVSAGAYVTPPADKSAVHSLLVCIFSPPGVIGGSHDSNGPISSTTDLSLSIGWGAGNQRQIADFLNNEYGSIAINSYDESSQTIGGPVDTISWGSPQNPTDTSLWTAPAKVSNPSQNHGQPFWQTNLFAHVGPLPSGTYWVASTLTIAGEISDGSTRFHTGESWYDTGCEMVVK